MRIAYFTDTYLPEINGVTRTLSRLGAYLDEQRIHHMVVAPSYDKTESGPSGYRRVRRFAGFAPALSPESRLAFPRFRDIEECCETFKPSLIHVTTELGIGFKGMRYALARNIPLVMSYQTDYCRYLRYFNLGFLRPLLEKYLSWFYAFARRILVPSRHTMEELFRRQYRNLDLWSRGIDAVRFNPGRRREALRNKLGKDTCIFLYVGRLSREKSLDMLLHAAAELERRFPRKTAFVFTGDGPCAESIKKSGLGNVVLTGFKQGRELEELYASADCFAFPSGTETFGNAALEAMASGLPVAGVSGGGVTDFLVHGHNALLCPPGDAGAFTGNLVSLMTNRGLRAALAENARRSALSRNWDQVFQGLIKVYAEVIDEGRRPRWRAAS